jgi:hypothetical protein
MRISAIIIVIAGVSKELAMLGAGHDLVMGIQQLHALLPPTVLGLIHLL